MPAPEKIHELIARFEQDPDGYRAGTYNETQLRREFLDPFFSALGWDMDNDDSKSLDAREVLHEYSMKIEGRNKAPDYCFRSGTTDKFFVEAKKPSVNLKEDPRPAFQTRNYGWHRGLPFCVLTDFEEFAVYDCRYEPGITESAQTARVFYCKYSEYDAQWEKISNWFARESVHQGALETQAKQTVKKGMVAFDAHFLNLISGWREELAKDIALRNRDLKLTQPDLNYAVQMTIDRILFLRMCEDRELEPFQQLQKLRDGKHIYAELLEIFRQADNRYNSGLFHFGDEKGRGGFSDKLTPQLKIDDEVLSAIIYKLYAPSPYNFRIMSVEILGQVYEQFLGKVIRLDGTKASIEEKPEVRKAGGVYYTPSYIVNYIVAQTVGKLCEGKTPAEVEKLKVLDPACGSGSFLIGAYNFLLEWHLKYYLAHEPEKLAAKSKPVLCAVASGEAGSGSESTPALSWRLTTREKKRILLANIYGVDIDRQAVEVTKLSLLLKMLEDDSDAAAPSLQPQLVRGTERLLPDLEANIKCGNSLIGHDFFESGAEYSEAERERINAFDWQHEYSAIMKSGGFDAVIGNPPYGFHQIHNQDLKPYLKSHYASSAGSFEHYFLFYEASLKVLNDGGYHGYIVPVTWLTIPSAAGLRRYILENYAIRLIAWLPELVFKDAQVNTLVSVIQKGQANTIEVLVSEVNDPGKAKGQKSVIKQTEFSNENNTIRLFESSREAELLDKIEANSVSLSTVARPCSGYNPYEVGKGQAPDGKPHSLQTVTEKPYHSSSKLGVEWKPEVIGRDLGRYTLRWPDNKFVKYGSWLSAPRDPNNFVGSRLLVQEITGGADRRIIATFCDRELYHSRDVIPIKCEQEYPSPLYLLGIVNSWLTTWRHHRRSPKAKKALFPKVLVSDLKDIPIRTINFSGKTEKAQHDQMVQFVERMLELNKQRGVARTAQDAASVERQIAATDKQIDRLVYELYDLTDEEIALVEGTDKPT